MDPGWSTQCLSSSLEWWVGRSVGWGTWLSCKMRRGGSLVLVNLGDAIWQFFSDGNFCMERWDLSHFSDGMAIGIYLPIHGWLMCVLVNVYCKYTTPVDAMGIDL